MTQTSKFQSDLSKEKWKRNLAIYDEYTKLTQDPTVSKQKVVHHLMKKYNLHSESTIWLIRKKVEAWKAQQS
jgi:hypothetical protein